MPSSQLFQGRCDRMRGQFRNSGAAALITLAACAAPSARASAAPLLTSGGAHDIEVLVDGAAAPEFFHAGESYVLGVHGTRYTLRVWNHSYARVEAVVSVDGLDVIDGKPADYDKRGYVIAPGSFVDIDGWRVSGAEVAAFRFGRVRDSYAARTTGPRNVGVIGVALFPERPRPVAIPRPPRRWFPWQPPRDYRPLGDAKAAADASSSEAAPAASAPAPAAAPEASRADRARSSAGAPMRSAPSRPGLGTEFGEVVASSVEQVPFVRANWTSPAAVLGLRYNDRAGLIAIGVDVDGRSGALLSDEQLRRSADPFPAADRPYASPPPGWRR
jgi:hypothetical protein